MKGTIYELATTYVNAKLKSAVKFKPTGKQLRNACARKRGKRFNQWEGLIFIISINDHWVLILLLNFHKEDLTTPLLLYVCERDTK